MQDQQTANQTALQQPRNDLQPNTTNLQQSGSPTAAGNTASVLSEAAPRGELRVSTATSPTPSSVTPSTVQPSSTTTWLLWLLLIPLIAAIAILLPRKTAVEEPVFESEIPTPKPTSTAPKKTKKKSAKRKQSKKK